MTFILAANLTDRILLAADSKVTLDNKQHDVVGYSIKLVQYNDQAIRSDRVVRSRDELGNCISCMFAGNKDFILFLHKKLSVAFESGELSADINILLNQVSEYFGRIIPEYDGKKEAFMIFAGVTLDNSIKMIDFNRISEILGKQAGQISDPNIAGALQFLSHQRTSGKITMVPLMDRETNLFVPGQLTFSFAIRERSSTFGIDRVGGALSIISGGSFSMDKDLEKQLLSYFLSKRDIEKEGIDIINFIRNKFSDTIGGAVIFGYIDKVKKALTHVSYEIDRSGGYNERNWSLKIDGKNFLAIDPKGQEIDLIQGFFNDSRGNQLYL